MNEEYLGLNRKLQATMDSKSMKPNSLPDFGYVYVLTNPSIPNLVKIGKTKLHPDGRAQQLSGETSSPTPFQVIYFREFQNMHNAERWVHNEIASTGKRTNPRREFFQIDAKAAIDKVLAAPDETTIKIESLINENENPISVSQQLFELGNAQLEGDNEEILHDEVAGLSNLERSASMNNIDALLVLGQHYHTEYMISKSRKITKLPVKNTRKLQKKTPV